MPLTPAQLATFKTHLLANTNQINGVAINVMPNNPDRNIEIANWYNSPALSGDAQAFAEPRTLWSPSVPIDLINDAVNWSNDPAGADVATRTLAILKWQSMTWNNQLKLTDNQTRAGVAAVWGAASSSNTAIKAVGTGRKAATRFEMVLAGASRGPNGSAPDGDNALNGRVSPVYGQLLTHDDVESARN